MTTRGLLAVSLVALVALVACNSQPAPNPAQEPASPTTAAAQPADASGKQFGAAFTLAGVEPLSAAIARAGKDARPKEQVGASPSAAGEHSCGGHGTKLEANDKLANEVDSCGSAVVQDDGEVVRVSGTVSAVCQKAGCWMTLQDGTNEARIFTREHKFFMPKDIAGKRAEVEGKLRAKTMSAGFAKHLAEDGGKDPSKVEGPQREFLVTATAVRIFD